MIAPTPVPTLAPLAEDETLFVDEEKPTVTDDPSDEKEENPTPPPTEIRDVNKPVNKKKKEKSEKANKEPDRNPVCPWEDE